MRKKTSAEKKEKVKGFGVWLKYFFMKWRFRLTQARDVFSLLTFAALLAVSYVQYISFLDNLGFWGVVILTLIAFLTFSIGGYIYDRILKLWTETNLVAIERNPYTYIPNPKEYWHSLAIWTYLFSALQQISDKLGIELEGEEEIRLFTKHYYSLNLATTNYEEEVKQLTKIAKKIEKDFLESGKITTYEKLDEELKESKLDKELKESKE